MLFGGLFYKYYEFGHTTWLTFYFFLLNCMEVGIFFHREGHWLKQWHEFGAKLPVGQPMADKGSIQEIINTSWVHKSKRWF